MRKKPFDMNAIPGQQRAVKATGDASRVAMESAQAIAQINQQAAQELATRIQERISELMKTQDPKTAFEYVHAEVLQDAAKEITHYHNQMLQVLASSQERQSRIDGYCRVYDSGLKSRSDSFC